MKEFRVTLKTCLPSPLTTHGHKASTQPILLCMATLTFCIINPYETDIMSRLHAKDILHRTLVTPLIAKLTFHTQPGGTLFTAHATVFNSSCDSVPQLMRLMLNSCCTLITVGSKS
mmetsp:Transcript_2068/g.3280  ORF Transcript_2068/g.3280 Transcript_2068/m.3280 type:complete len:116 (-) Transcript_2068:1585-1932(-)